MPGKKTDVKYILLAGLFLASFIGAQNLALS